MPPTPPPPPPKIDIPDDYDDGYEYDSVGKYAAAEVAKPSHAHKSKLVRTKQERGVKEIPSGPVESLGADGGQAGYVVVLRSVLRSMHDEFGIPAPLILLGCVSLVVGTAVCCLCLCVFCLFHPRGHCRGRRRNRKRVRVVEDAGDFVEH